MRGLNPPVNINIAPLAEGEIDRIQYPRSRAEHKKRKREEMKNNKSPKLKFSRSNNNEKVPLESAQEEDKANEQIGHQNETSANENDINNLMNNNTNNGEE